jgi:hypothetical protein
LESGVFVAQEHWGQAIICSPCKLDANPKQFFKVPNNFPLFASIANNKHILDRLSYCITFVGAANV